MRAPFRTGLLALLCALMLGIATIANANIPGRPIDRPEGPPDPDPTMVGDPDEPGLRNTIPVIFLGRIYLVHLPSGVARQLRLQAPDARTSGGVRSIRAWGRHAR